MMFSENNTLKQLSVKHFPETALCDAFLISKAQLDGLIANRHC